MSTFTDGNGREWHIVVSVDDIRRVKTETGVYLTKLVDDQLSPLVELLADTLTLVDVIYCLVRPQADSLGITDVQFAQAICGDVLDHAANAFVEALIGFFPKSQRDLLSKLIAKGKKVQEALAKKAEIAIDQLNEQTYIDSVLNSPAS